NQVHLKVEGYYPAQEIRTAEVSAAVSHVAAVPKVRVWMKTKQRECIRFGNLVMEGRDIGTNVFPETDFKYYLDAQLEERSRRLGLLSSALPVLFWLARLQSRARAFGWPCNPRLQPRQLFRPSAGGVGIETRH